MLKYGFEVCFRCRNWKLKEWLLSREVVWSCATLPWIIVSHCSKDLCMCTLEVGVAKWSWCEEKAKVGKHEEKWIFINTWILNVVVCGLLLQYFICHNNSTATLSSIFTHEFTFCLHLYLWQSFWICCEPFMLCIIDHAGKSVRCLFIKSQQISLSHSRLKIAWV